MKTRSFRIAALTTLISLFLLILAGSIVRTTGSGMGCPDWPHCFGQWIPPTDISQLPLDYKTRFAVAGREIADFHALKTWIEYINRLLGVIVGIEMMWLIVTAWPLRKIRPHLLRGSFIVFILTCIQGGIGARVVKTHLAPHLITLHMVLALVIVMLTAALWLSVQAARRTLTARSNLLGKIVLALGLIQLVLGTEVREGVDHLTNAGLVERAHMLNHDSIIFMIHRSFSIVFLVVFFVWISQLWKEEPIYSTRKFMSALLFVTLLAPITGMILAYLGMPAFAQPLHLGIATLILSGVFVLIYRPRHAAL